MLKTPALTEARRCYHVNGTLEVPARHIAVNGLLLAQ